MSKKCDLIGLGKINKYMLLILLGTCFNVLLYEASDWSHFFKDVNQHPVIYNLAYSLGLCLSCVFYIKYKCDNRKKNQINNNSLSQANTTKDPLKELPFFLHEKKIISEKAKIAWIFLVSIIDYISMFFNSYYWIQTDKYFINWPFGLIIMSLFSYLILKTKMHKHHYLSSLIILALGITYIIVSEIFSKENIEKYYMSYIFTFLSENSFFILFIVYKYFMIKKFIKSFEILFYEGIFETIIGIITLIITTKIGKIDNFFDFQKNSNYKDNLVLISLIIFNFATYLLKYIVIDLFTPFHAFLITMLSLIISFLTDMDFKEITTILALIFFIVGLLLVLIYIEVIELNFCGLSYMTKKNIDIRAQNDALFLESNGNEEDDKITDSGYELSLNSENNKGSKENNNNIKENIQDKNIQLEMEVVDQMDDTESQNDIINKETNE